MNPFVWFVLFVVILNRKVSVTVFSLFLGRAGLQGEGVGCVPFFIHGIERRLLLSGYTG
jgi:hypothetical protein